MNIIFICAVLVATSVCYVTSEYQARSLSQYMFRRQTDWTTCNSYALLKQDIQEAIFPMVGDYLATIFSLSPISRSDLLEQSVHICCDISREDERIRDGLSECPCPDEVAARMDVYNGSVLCKADGSVTDFFTDLMTDFDSVEMDSWTSDCMDTLLHDLYIGCRFGPFQQYMGFAEGLEMYERIMKSAFECVLTKVDNIDVTACGDKTSVKRIALIIELLYNVGPGANFTMADFGL